MWPDTWFICIERLLCPLVVKLYILETDGDVLCVCLCACQGWCVISATSFNKGTIKSSFYAALCCSYAVLPLSINSVHCVCFAVHAGCHLKGLDEFSCPNATGTLCHDTCKAHLPLHVDLELWEKIQHEFINSSFFLKRISIQKFNWNVKCRKIKSGNVKMVKSCQNIYIY